MNINVNINGVLNLLSKNYPNAKIALNYRNNWQLFIAVVLSAQCTDKKVNEVTEKLFSAWGVFLRRLRKKFRGVQGRCSRVSSGGVRPVLHASS